MFLLKTLLISAAWVFNTALAQTDCPAFSPDDTQVVDRGPVKTVIGPLAKFNPCHPTVRVDTPSFFSPKHGDQAPLVIIAHGGGGLGSYERDFAKLMNQHGYATLVFDAFEMNGLVSRSDLLVYFMGNGARQRMIYKATLGAYQWVLQNPKLDSKVDKRKLFIQGLSNGGAVAINMAAATDAAHVRGVIAEGAPSTGIGFPDDLKVPLLLLYGSADNYGGQQADDWMHLRKSPCGHNDHDAMAPHGFAQFCNRNTRQNQPMPSPQDWYEGIKSKGQSVQLELVDGGGHGMMFTEFSTSSRQLAGGRTFYRSQGASADTWLKVKQLVLAFMASKL